MVKQFSFTVLPLVILIATGCDNSINPSAPFVPRMVVYSVLSTVSDTQYVRVYTNYNPPQYNPLLNSDEQSLADANVTMTDGSNTYTFRYASITRPDTSRYKNKIGVYYAYPFRPQANKEYRLNVSSPTFGQATSKTVVPGSGKIDCFTIAELYFPSRAEIAALFVLNDLAKAQLVRFYIVYTTENPGEVGKEKYYEVPVFWKIIDLNYEIHQTIFPSPTRRTSPVNRRDQTFYQGMTYPFPTYNESIYKIIHYNFNVRFKRAVFQLIQFDEFWYKHYAAANLFQDRLAVRLDPPDYSNIQGGSGMFGSFRVDSTVIPLPEYIPPYR